MADLLICNKHKASESSLPKHKCTPNLGIKMNQMIISLRAEPQMPFFCIPIVECYHIAWVLKKNTCRLAQSNLNSLTLILDDYVV